MESTEQQVSFENALFKLLQDLPVYVGTSHVTNHGSDLVVTIIKKIKILIEVLATFHTNSVQKMKLGAIMEKWNILEKFLLEDIAKLQTMNEVINNSSSLFFDGALKQLTELSSFFQHQYTLIETTLKNSFLPADDYYNMAFPFSSLHLENSQLSAVNGTEDDIVDTHEPSNSQNPFSYSAIPLLPKYNALLMKHARAGHNNLTLLKSLEKCPFPFPMPKSIQYWEERLNGKNGTFNLLDQWMYDCMKWSALDYQVLRENKGLSSLEKEQIRDDLVQSVMNVVKKKIRTAFIDILSWEVERIDCDFIINQITTKFDSFPDTPSFTQTTGNTTCKENLTESDERKLRFLESNEGFLVSKVEQLELALERGMREKEEAEEKLKIMSKDLRDLRIEYANLQYEYQQVQKKAEDIAASSKSSTVPSSEKKKDLLNSTAVTNSPQQHNLLLNSSTTPLEKVPPIKIGLTTAAPHIIQSLFKEVNAALAIPSQEETFIAPAASTDTLNPTRNFNTITSVIESSAEEKGETGASFLSLPMTPQESHHIWTPTLHTNENEEETISPLLVSQSASYASQSQILPTNYVWKREHNFPNGNPYSIYDTMKIPTSMSLPSRTSSKVKLNTSNVGTISPSTSFIPPDYYSKRMDLGINFSSQGDADVGRISHVEEDRASLMAIAQNKSNNLMQYYRNSLTHCSILAFEWRDVVSKAVYQLLMELGIKEESSHSRLCQLGEVIKIDGGSTFIQQGETSTHLLYVIEGEVEALVETAKQKKLFRLDLKEPKGFLCLEQSQLYSSALKQSNFTFRTKTEVFILSLPIEGALKVLGCPDNAITEKCMKNNQSIYQALMLAEAKENSQGENQTVDHDELKNRKKLFSTLHTNDFHYLLSHSLILEYKYCDLYQREHTFSSSLTVVLSGELESTYLGKTYMQGDVLGYDIYQIYVDNNFSSDDLDWIATMNNSNKKKAEEGGYSNEEKELEEKGDVVIPFVSSDHKYDLRISSVSCRLMVIPFYVLYSWKNKERCEMDVEDEREAAVSQEKDYQKRETDRKQNSSFAKSIRMALIANKWL